MLLTINKKRTDSPIKKWAKATNSHRKEVDALKLVKNVQPHSIESKTTMRYQFSSIKLALLSTGDTNLNYHKHFEGLLGKIHRIKKMHSSFDST